MLQRLDWNITEFFNQFAGKHQIVDRSIHFLADYSLTSSMLLLAVICYLWFREKADSRPIRARMIAEIIGAALAGPISRGLQLILRFHPRPLHDPSMAFHVPYGVDPEILNHWSSFPSDHAAVYFGLATVIWLHSRWLGAAAWVWAALLCVLRVYLGYHWTSDILGGAAIGILCVLAFRTIVPRVLLSQALTWEERWPGIFYAFAFLACYQVGTLFEDLRHLGASLLQAARIIGF
ncbi:MAG TPA: phosphatase PAP2 family protein [Bryobacteraceae bacterium]|nr:phosphatase PAP2 family protein [Bryobacteraceae bacterium]